LLTKFLLLLILPLKLHWKYFGAHRLGFFLIPIPAVLPHLFYYRWLKPMVIKKDVPSHRGYFKIFRLLFIFWLWATIGIEISKNTV
jgi:hypothetical protein